MVWAKTTKVGCAAVNCDADRGTFIICEYDPPGNVLGVQAYGGCGRFNQTDIFSFGVIILEILTGRRNTISSETIWTEHLLSYVWENWTRGTITEIVDPSLRCRSAESEILKCIHIGLLCVQENPGDRPRMSNVILMIVGKSTTLPAPSRPAFLFRLNDENHIHHGINNLNPSLNKVTITELEPR
uniref:SCP domain-containing protein n=1 Tax=Oryza rufipogon TaxID=4529 RepID=A0A0E0NES5_ORYRU